MSDLHESKERFDKIGEYLTGLWILSVIGIIWIDEDVVWQIFGTVSFLLLITIGISSHIDKKIKENDSIHP